MTTTFALHQIARTLLVALLALLSWLVHNGLWKGDLHRVGAPDGGSGAAARHLNQRHDPPVRISDQSGRNHATIWKHDGNGAIRLQCVVDRIIAGACRYGLVSVIVPGISRVRPVRPLFQPIANAGIKLVQRVRDYIC